MGVVQTVALRAGQLPVGGSATIGTALASGYRRIADLFHDKGTD